MEHLEPALLWIAAICGSIATIYGFISKVKKPYNELTKRVEELEKTATKNREKLDSDHDSFLRQQEVNELLLNGVNNILLHELTGNHTPQMEQCSKQIENFIYKRGGSL